MSKQIIQLLAVGELAMDVWRAEAAKTNAKDAYIRDIRRFEHANGDIPGGRIKPADPAHAAAVAFTAGRYAAYQAAKSRVHSCRSKMRRACVKMARIAAGENGGAR